MVLKMVKDCFWAFCRVLEAVQGIRTLMWLLGLGGHPAEEAQQEQSQDQGTSHETIIEEPEFEAPPPPQIDRDRYPMGRSQITLSKSFEGLGVYHTQKCGGWTPAHTLRHCDVCRSMEVKKQR